MTGHNDLVGQYNGGKPKYIYRDCYCKMKQLSNPRPKCKLITIADIMLLDSIGKTPGEKVNHRHKNVDTGSNGGNVNQHKQTRVEVDLNSADQLLWRCPQCSYTNDEEISRAVFGDTDEWARVCVICYISCPREVNSA